jgi:hypothetical protein
MRISKELTKVDFKNYNDNFFWFQEVLMVSREIERDERKEKSYANTSYEFNKFKSDAIGTFRDLPDTRHPK